jgi:hypothetical protein
MFMILDLRLTIDDLCASVNRQSKIDNRQSYFPNIKGSGFDDLGHQVGNGDAAQGAFGMDEAAVT